MSEKKLIKNFFVRLIVLIFLLGFIGLIRNALEIALGIRVNQKWYSFDLDINLTMFIGPIYLCFFGAFILHFLSKKLGESTPYRKIFSYTLYLQLLHLAIPFLDFLGFKFRIPFLFVMPFPYIESYFTPALTMSFGIIFAWIFTAFTMAFIFIKVFKTKICKSIIILTISFATIYFPTYHLFPTFNTLFNSLFLPDMHWSKAFYGYAIFFLLCSLIGIRYFLIMQKKKSNNK
ncbi:MAG: hypothetical protein QW400_04110 [Candidatus Diapherotrites archaeon]